jgi:hypothetical protein
MNRPILDLMGRVVLSSILLTTGTYTFGADKRIFLLEDAEHRRWCAYSSESVWKSQVTSLSATLVSTLELEDDHLAAVSVTEEDEAGDWIVYDHYSLDSKGELQNLKRTINVAASDTSEDETYLIRNGKAKKQGRVTRKLSTGEISPPKKEWLPDVPMVTHIQDFPFADLAREKLPEVQSKGSVCLNIKGP